jgi:hypothetical protein
MQTQLPSPSPLPVVAAGIPRPAFSADLRELVARFEDRPVRIVEILEATQGRGYHLLLLLIALPFVGPIPLPGFSIPFGLVVLLMLPFPLPFSNSLPAWTVLLLSAGALGRDGLFFFAGCAMFLVSLAFFALVVFGGVEAFEILRWVFRG